MTRCRILSAVAAFTVDEVKARPAGAHVDAEAKACEIRLRAERRAGQLLKAREKAKGAQGLGSNQHKGVPSQAASTSSQ